MHFPKLLLSILDSEIRKSIHSASSLSRAPGGAGPLPLPPFLRPRKGVAELPQPACQSTRLKFTGVQAAALPGVQSIPVYFSIRGVHKWCTRSTQCTSVNTQHIKGVLKVYYDGVHFHQVYSTSAKGVSQQSIYSAGVPNEYHGVNK